MAVTEERRTDAPVASGSGLAAELIEKARAAFEAGEKDKAFDCLDRAVANTADRELLRQIRELAKRGYDEAGFISRHTMWSGLLKAVDRALPPED